MDKDTLKAIERINKSAISLACIFEDLSNALEKIIDENEEG